VYPGIQANFGSSIWNLGRIVIETNTDAGVILNDLVEHPNQTRSDELNMGIVTGDLSFASVASPELFWSPDKWKHAECTLGDQKVLLVNYRDFADKHPDLAPMSYRISIVVEYLEEEPALDGLEGSIRERIYNDLSESHYLLHDIDTDKYANDANYSVIHEIKSRIADYTERIVKAESTVINTNQNP
jgi:hypothetical protein